MNNVVLLGFTATLSAISFAAIYFIPYFSKKPLRKGKFDGWQFVKIFFSPILVIPIFYFLYRMITSNPENPVIYIPKYMSDLSFLFFFYFLVLGNGIHAVSVVLSKHMKNLQKHTVWEVNEFFHHAFSHFLIEFSAIMLVFTYVILEINHPSILMLTNLEILLILVSGIIIGIILGLASIEGSIANSMFLIFYILSLAIPFIFIKFNLDFRFFPFASIVETMLITSVVCILFYRHYKKGFPEIVPQYFFE